MRAAAAVLQTKVANKRSAQTSGFLRIRFPLK